MFSMKRIIIVVALLVLSFGISFVLSMFLGGGRQPPTTTQPAEGDAEVAENGGPVPGPDPEKLVPKEVELTELVKELRHRLSESQRRRDLLDRREKRIEMAAKDLGAKADEIEQLRIKLVEPLAELKKTMQSLQQMRISVTKQEIANLKKTAAIYEKMDSASGSQILEKMCENKQDQDVVKILRYMAERPAAKLLAEMPDKALAAKLSGQLKLVSEKG